MAFGNRRFENRGGQPGFTPIDDVHGANRASHLDPDDATGRLPSQDADSATGGGKKRRSATKKRRRSA